jgi:hypothetical protein
MTLKDAPGGAKLIESLTDAVKKLSLLYAGTPDDQARSSLEAYIGRIEAAIIEAVGARKAPTLLNAFRGAVMTRKQEIETGAPNEMIWKPIRS